MFMSRRVTTLDVQSSKEQSLWIDCPPRFGKTWKNTNLLTTPPFRIKHLPVSQLFLPNWVSQNIVTSSFHTSILKKTNEKERIEWLFSYRIPWVFSLDSPRCSLISCLQPLGVGLFPAAAASLGGSSQPFAAGLAAGAAGGTAARPWRVSPGPWWVFSWPSKGIRGVYPVVRRGSEQR